MWDEEPKAGTNILIPDKESEEEPLEGVEQEETSTLSSQNMMGGGCTDFHPSKGGQYEQIQFPSKSVTCSLLCPHMAFPL